MGLKQSDSKETLLLHLNQLVDDIKQSAELLDWEFRVNPEIEEIEPVDGYRNYRCTGKRDIRLNVSYVEAKK